MTSSETRLHSGEGTVGFEMIGDLFINEDFRKAGQDGYKSVTVWVQSVPPFEEGDDRGNRSNFTIFGDPRQYEREVE